MDVYQVLYSSILVLFISFVGVFLLIFVCTAAWVWWEYNLQSTASTSWGSPADVDRVSHIMLEIYGFNAFSMSRKNHV